MLHHQRKVVCLGLGLQLTAPMVFGQSGPLLLTEIYFEAECHIAMAIVKMSGKWVRRNAGDKTENAVFALPMPSEGTVRDHLVFTVRS